MTWSRSLPRTASLGDTISGAARPAEGYGVQAISVHHEAAPEVMPAIVANAIASYSLPEQRHDYLPRLRSHVHRHDDGTFHLVREEYTDGSRGHFGVADDGAFNFTVPLHDGPGVYTVVVWVTKKGDRTPIAASNISIRVTESFAGTR